MFVLFEKGIHGEYLGIFPTVFEAMEQAERSIDKNMFKISSLEKSLIGIREGNDGIYWKLEKLERKDT